ncbi:hypothetical protein WIS52_13610 [Pseudonocardia nematodicida]|uniref:Uncharacterized protein n=1 Tax=Pseudonocardia nematodicida TaxID=1206997 RepID=A0ABV1KAK1_9PSEU
MTGSPIAAAAVAAVVALALPVAALATPALPTAATWALITVTVLLAVAVVAVTGAPGHRAAARALRRGEATADVGVSAATLPALAWSVPVLLVGAISPEVPATALSSAGDGGAPVDPVLLPGLAAVLTVAAVAVRGTGREDARSRPAPDGGTERGTDHAAAGPSPDAEAGLRTLADRWSARLVPFALLAAVAVAGARAGAGEPVVTVVPAALAVLLAACPVALLAVVPAAVRAADRAGGTAVRLPLPVSLRPVPAADAGPSPVEWLDPVGWTAPAGPAVADRVDTVVLAGPDVLGGCGPGTVEVHPATDEDREKVLRLAASVAAGAAPGSDLAPVGRALAAAVRDGGGEPPEVAEADERPGLGVSGLVAELITAEDDTTVVAHAVLLGSPDWLLEHGIALPPEVATERERAEDTGLAVVAVAWDGTARGVLTLDRAPHREAADGVAALRSRGARPALLTPDGEGPAGAIAVAAGLDPADEDEVRAGLEGAGRAAAVAGLQVCGRTVAVAADPDADPAALARADLAIALTPPAPGDGDGAPPPVAPAGSAMIAVRGGPAEIAQALDLARRARGHTRSGLVAGVAVVVAGAVVAVAGAPVAPAGVLPVVAGLVLHLRRLRRRPPRRLREARHARSRTVRLPGYLRVG